MCLLFNLVRNAHLQVWKCDLNTWSRISHSDFSLGITVCECKEIEVLTFLLHSSQLGWWKPQAVFSQILLCLEKSYLYQEKWKSIYKEVKMGKVGDGEGEVKQMLSSEFWYLDLPEASSASVLPQSVSQLIFFIFKY